MNAPTVRRRVSDALFLVLLATVVTVVRILVRDEDPE